MPSLSVLHKGRLVATHELGSDPVVIGRDESADLVLNDPSVSRRHLKISPTQTGYQLEDLETENGTFVNGVREWSCEVQADVTIQLGEAILLYHAESTGVHRRLNQRQRGSTDIYLEGSDLPSTCELHPTHLRELQTTLRIQTKPHLVLQAQPGRLAEDEYFALTRPVTTIGYGPVNVSLGQARKPTVFAEVHRVGDSYEMQARGLLPKVRYRGKRTSKLALQAGTRVEIDGFGVVYRPGVDIGR